MKVSSVLFLIACMLGISAEDAVLSQEVFAVDRQMAVEKHTENLKKQLARFHSKNAFADYLELLDELADPRYLVLPGKEFARHPGDPQRITVYLRHDIDVDPFTAVRMAKEEKKRNLRGSYYILPTARYYGTVRRGKLYHYSCMDPLYKELASYGHEIGVHNDLLTIMFYYNADPLAFQQQELAHYRSIGLNITGCVSHGSPLNRLKLNNTLMFSEFRRKGSYEYKGKTFYYGRHALKDYGFDYEGYRLKANVRLSDIAKYPGSEIRKKLRACKKGDRVSLLVHPIHWKDETKSGK